MDNPIACRLASYGPHHERAWTHLPELGIRHIEVPIPAPDECATMRQRLADSGLTATSAQVRCFLAEPDIIESMTRQCETCRALGIALALAPVRAGEMAKQVAYDRLRELGDVARAYAVTIVLETHPDLLTHGWQARETIEAISHPNVRINFDPANIYFYNEGLDPVAELAVCIADVAAIHLKDSHGTYQSYDFPPLGDGIIDFPSIVALLREHRYAGPMTIELDVARDVPLDETATCLRVERSVTYLRSLGVL
jgi:sugar phosphate isomerase/epimerase